MASVEIPARSWNRGTFSIDELSAEVLNADRSHPKIRIAEQTSGSATERERKVGAVDGSPTFRRKTRLGQQFTGRKKEGHGTGRKANPSDSFRAEYHAYLPQPLQPTKVADRVTGPDDAAGGTNQQSPICLIAVGWSSKARLISSASGLFATAAAPRIPDGSPAPWPAPPSGCRSCFA